ncbi:MAG: hypothetical protein AAFY71_05735 [Bacteroidota bacterium]
MTTKTYFSSLTILWFAFIMGQILFAGVAYYVGKTDGLLGEEESTLENLFIYIVPAVAVSAIGISTFLHRNILGQAKNQTGLSGKMDKYRSAFIIKMALHEGPSLLSLVAFFLTGNMLFLAVSGVIILLQAVMRPSPEKAIEELQLVGDEKDILQREDGKVG